LKFKITIDNKTHDVEVKQEIAGYDPSPLAIDIDGKTLTVTIVERDEKAGTERVKVGEKEFKIGIEDMTIMSGKPLIVKINEVPFEVKVDTLARGTAQAVPKTMSGETGMKARLEEASTKAVPRIVTEGEKDIVPPMPGKVVSVKVKEGDSVITGDVVLILEAMKMANEIASPFQGKVKEVRVSNGQSVTVEDVLMVIE
jgi:biotin carboxyl carrier protein